MLESYKGSMDLARAGVHEELTTALAFANGCPTAPLRSHVNPSDPSQATMGAVALSSRIRNT